MYLTLVAALGRAYTSEAAIRSDWAEGKDFTINDVSCKWDGSYINKEQADDGGITVNIRYNKNRSVCAIKPS